MATLGGKSLNGFYRYDDEGIGAARALVEAGVLRNFLSPGIPWRFLEIQRARAGAAQPRPVARMANLIATSTKQVSDAELKQMLIAEAKRQGSRMG